MAPLFLAEGTYLISIADRPESWKTVAVVFGMTIADILKGRLETEGIPVRMRYESAGRVYAITLDGLGEVELLVPSFLLERARKVLADSFGDDEIPWKEPLSE